MFNPDFYPTPEQTVYDMLSGFDVTNKIILEPSAGKGNIIDILQMEGAKEILACEVNEDLRSILNTKCKVIENDFLELKSDKISHIDAIIMNPPFSADEKHILHAYEIAPAGCEIISLCNIQTLSNAYSASRKRLVSLIQSNGNFIDLGDCFSDSERRTGVSVGLIRLKKPGDSYKTEFEGFFLDDEPEQEQENGIMSYDFIRDIVNRYIEAVKIFDKQLQASVEMNQITKSFYSSKLATSVSSNNVPILREDFKKDLQKSAWNFIFDKLKMEKFMTRGVKDDINKFVEQQTHIPFTMRNIYVMLEGLISTTEQRIDKSILEVFDKLTQHHHANRYNLPGWKTNSHYLVNKKFIFPYIGSIDAYRWSSNYNTYKIYRSDCESIEDLEKALCYINGINWDDIQTVYGSCNDNNYGIWYESHFFKYKAFKKGTLHVEFKNEDFWAKFNQRVAKIKGYPLYENVKKEPAKPKAKKQSPPKQANVLFEFKISA